MTTTKSNPQKFIIDEEITYAGYPGKVTNYDPRYPGTYNINININGIQKDIYNVNGRSLKRNK